MTALPNQPTPANYLLASVSDRDRLLLQFDVFRDAFRKGFDLAVAASGVDTGRPFRILDVACGEGLYATDVSNRYPQALVVGFDRDAEAIATAKSAFCDNERLTFHCADVHDDFGDQVGGGFDVAFLQCGLSHFRLGSVALRQVTRVLRPGGAIMLLDSKERNFDHPHPSSLVLANAVRAAWPQYGTYAAGDRHEELLSEAGFINIVSYPQNHPLGGESALGQANFINLMQLLRSMRLSLVERAKVISDEEFDEHWSRLNAANDPQKEGTSYFQQTVARKPA